jgi:hypothetical protein
LFLSALRHYDEQRNINGRTDEGKLRVARREQRVKERLRRVYLLPTAHCGSLKTHPTTRRLRTKSILRTRCAPSVSEDDCTTLNLAQLHINVAKNVLLRQNRRDIIDRLTTTYVAKNVLPRHNRRDRTPMTQRRMGMRGWSNRRFTLINADDEK